MVQCGLVDRCRRHEWYHRDCLPAAEQNRAQDGERTFQRSECHIIVLFWCRGPDNLSLGSGSGPDDSPHLDQCFLSPSDPFSPPAPWFCSESCSAAAEGDDFVLNYTRAVVWEGLYHLARRDAILEGDGDAMTDFWRTDLVLLWSREHLQMFGSAHRLLTGTTQNGGGTSY